MNHHLQYTFLSGAGAGARAGEVAVAGAGAGAGAGASDAIQVIFRVRNSQREIQDIRLEFQ